MDPALTTDVFVHIRIVLGTIIGLGVTRLLMGVAGLVQHRSRHRLSVIHLLWCLSILIELVLFWWWEFELRGLQHWSFAIFAFLISYAVTLFLLAALLFPDNSTTMTAMRTSSSSAAIGSSRCLARPSCST